MGFMDKMKDAASQAGDYAKSAGELAKDGMNPASKGEADRLNRIGKSGIETPATLKSMTVNGDANKLSGGAPCTFVVEVQPPGGTPYEATFEQQLIQQSIDGYTPHIGGTINVKVDPEDPNAMLAWTIPGA